MIKYFVLVFIILLGTSHVQSQTVYKTPPGKKYHIASCRMVENVSSALTVAEANKSGLEPCKICKPATATVQGLKSQPPSGVNTTVQCKGLTKAKARCKHMTSIANAYCYQHTAQGG
jgi:methylphosphotriester-DNA--protein-cysteine methyltransferase